MPSTSKKQHNLMAMVANDPAASKRLGIPKSVGKEFTAADKGIKFSSGTRVDSQVVNQPKTNHGAQAVNESKTNHGEKSLFSKGGKTMATKKLPPFMGKETKAEEAKEMKIKAKGGISSSLKAHAAAPASKAHASMAKGGGVESKGKSKGKMIAMCGGGMSKKK